MLSLQLSTQSVIFLRRTRQHVLAIMLWNMSLPPPIEASALSFLKFDVYCTNFATVRCLEAVNSMLLTNCLSSSPTCTGECAERERWILRLLHPFVLEPSSKMCSAGNVWKMESSDPSLVVFHFLYIFDEVCVGQLKDALVFLVKEFANYIASETWTGKNGKPKAVWFNAAKLSDFFIHEVPCHCLSSQSIS